MATDPSINDLERQREDRQGSSRVNASARLSPTVKFDGITRDFALSVVGAGAFAAALQVVAYPFLSRRQDAAAYGELLLMMGVVNVVGSALGGALNNSRLVRRKEYDDVGARGDYNLIVMFAIAICVVLVGLVCLVVSRSMDYAAGCGVLSVLVFFRSYFSVSFRLTINYSRMLTMYVFASFGVLLGIGLFLLVEFWPVVFLSAELSACAYILCRAPEVREPVKSTPLFGGSLKSYLMLSISMLLGSGMMYFDRFFLFPLLGAEYVATFVVASYLGKTTGILLTPIAGVLLTYYSRDSRLDVRQFFIHVAMMLTAGAAMFLCISVVAVPVTEILYPTLSQRSGPYLALANLGAILLVLGGMVQAALVRFCSPASVLVVQGAYLAAFLIAAYAGIQGSGLIGFLWAGVVVNTARMLLIVLVVVWSARREKSS